MALKSRTSLDNIIRGSNPAAECGRCDPDYIVRWREVADPGRESARRERARQAAERRQAAKVAEQARERVRQAERDRASRRRDVFHQEYPMFLWGEGEPHWRDLWSRFRTELGVLALLDYAPSATPIPPPLKWESRFAPDTELIRRAVRDGLWAQLIRLHPDASPLSTLEWDAEDPNRPTGRFYALEAHWYAWQGPSMGTSALRLQEHLRQRVDAWLWTEQGVLDAVDLAVELITAETLSYMAAELDLHNLAPVSDNHAPRLLESAQALATTRSLGECYSIAWRAVRSAAAASQQHPYASAQNMTTHAVNWFETNALPAATDREVPLPIYRETLKHPVSQLTRTLFIRVLDKGLMETSPTQISAELTERSGFPKPLSTVYDGEGDPDNLVEPGTTEVDGGDSTVTRQAHLIEATLASASDTTLTLEPVDAVLAAGMEPVVTAAGISAQSHSAILDAFKATAAFRRVMARSLTEDQTARSVIAFAYLLPGTYTSDGTGEVRSIGELLGQHFEAALGISGGAGS